MSTSHFDRLSSYKKERSPQLRRSLCTSQSLHAMSLSTSVPIPVKGSFKSFFCGEYWPYYKNYLYPQDNETYIPYRITVPACHTRYCNHRYQQGNPAKPITQSAKIMVGEFPGVLIFHGHRCSISIETIYLLRRFLLRNTAKSNHKKRSQQKHEAHKYPKSHTQPPCHLLQANHPGVNPILS